MKNWEVLLALAVVPLPLSPPVAGTELTPMSRTLTSAGFAEIGTTDGVTAYQDEASEIIRVAAEGEFDSPPEKVLEALLAYDRQPGIVERVSESRVLERGENRIVVYQHLNLPVVSDRDYTLRVQWGKDGDTTWLVYKAVGDAGPAEKEGVVRVLDHEGSWQLQPIRDGAATKVRFQMHIDLAGSLPRWMARSGAADELPAMFESIRRLMATPSGG
ncbi:MAG: hypothetical protein HY905_20695 [Deltaproteobacteria bacterium]|nr:hypothetical protein [Deltaproteobacteria bacterium]